MNTKRNSVKHIRAAHPGRDVKNARTTPDQQRYQKMKKQRDQLRLELARVQAERDEYRTAVIALMREDIDFDKKELLALRGQRPTIDELIGELQSCGAQ